MRSLILRGFRSAAGGDLRGALLVPGACRRAEPVKQDAAVTRADKYCRCAVRVVDKERKL